MYTNYGAFTYMENSIREGKMKKIFFLASVVVLIVLVTIGIKDDQSLMLGVSVIDEAQFKELTSGLKKIDFDSNLMYEESSIPYIENMNTYIVTQSMENDYWQGRIFSDYPSARCYILETNLTKEEIIASGTALRILIVCDEGYEVENLIISGLPIVSMRAHSADEENFYGTVKILENASAGRTGVIDVNEYSCRYHYRGAASMLREKKPYKLNLLNSKGKSKKVSLLGMREDNDWILNPLSAEQSAMREKIAYDLWNQLSDVNTHDMEYCELIVDGQYRGLYCLQEPVDIKTYGKPKATSYLYSVKQFALVADFGQLFQDNVVETLMENDMRIAEYSIDEYGEDNLELAIELLRCMDANLKGRTYETELSVRFDVETTATHDVLINMIQAIDNTSKNQKLCIYKESGTEYIITKSPWDLDWSMYHENYAFAISGPTEIFADVLFYGDQEEYNNKRKEIYFMARAQFFNEEWINSVISTYEQQLTQSGAIGRNDALWGGDFQAGCDALREFFKVRIPAVDEYYGGL